MRQHGHAGTGLARGVAVAALAAAILAGAAGCTHNYYYGTPVACAPAVTTPGVVENGALCEVPTQVVDGGTVVSGRPLVATPVLGGARPPKVVLSQPNGGSRLGGWRSADSEGSLATTRVEGAVDDPTLTR
jgi:hypothetical protein